MTGGGPLAGRRVLIASGPTFAPLDDVRSITNHSTGRLGSVIAAELARRGAEVILLAGETSQTPPAMYPGEAFPNLAIEPFRTVPQLRDALRRHLTGGRIGAALMAAAVLDYLPVKTEAGKKSSAGDEWTITLRRGEKLIEQIRGWSPDTLIVGFKLESNIGLDELRSKALDLMARSGAALVVANRLQEIGGEGHTAYLFGAESMGDGAARPEPLATREAIAGALADRLEIELRNR